MASINYRLFSLCVDQAKASSQLSSQHHTGKRDWRDSNPGPQGRGYRYND